MEDERELERRLVDEENAQIDEINRQSDERHREMERITGRSIPMTPHLPHVAYSASKPGFSPLGEEVARPEEMDPFSALEPGSARARSYAHEEGPSGRPRWMEPFSKVDVLGNPTVFSEGFDPIRRG